MNIGGVSAERILNDLDLEPIMVKAMDHEEGLGWALDFTRAVADEYRKYLVMCLEDPEGDVVPSSYVDEFWHLHILDTSKYATDCGTYLGFFLHHFPYFGMRGEEDAKNLADAWTATKHRYSERFGPVPEVYWPASTRCPNCGKRCKQSRPGVRREDRPRLADVQSQT